MSFEIGCHVATGYYTGILKEFLHLGGRCVRSMIVNHAFTLESPEEHLKKKPDTSVYRLHPKLTKSEPWDSGIVYLKALSLYVQPSVRTTGLDKLSSIFQLNFYNIILTIGCITLFS